MRSPQQLFTEQALRLQYSGQIAVDYNYSIDEDYGYEEEGIAATDDVGVDVPAVGFQLLDEHLQQAVNQLEISNSYGINLPVYANFYLWISRTISKCI